LSNANQEVEDMDRLPPLPKSLTVSLEQQLAEEREQTDKYRYEATTGVRSRSATESEELECQQQRTDADNESSWRLDEKMRQLRREMTELRRMDLSLLSQLNALRDNIVSYKRTFNIDNNVNEYDDNCDYQNYVPYMSNTAAAGSYRYLKRNENERCSDDDDSDDDVDEDNVNDNASDLSDEREDTTESSHSTV